MNTSDRNDRIFSEISQFDNLIQQERKNKSMMNSKLTK